MTEGWVVIASRMLLYLIGPAAVLAGAVLLAKRWLRARTSFRAPALVLVCTYPVWVVPWLALIAILGGMFGPCNVPSDLSTTAIIGFLFIPSLLCGFAFWHYVGSPWMLAAPFIADAAVLGLAGLMGSIQGRGFVVQQGWNAPWSPYVWVGMVILIGAWCIRRRVSPSEPKCSRCGYSLAGLDQECTCPECGESGKPSALPSP